MSAFVSKIMEKLHLIHVPRLKKVLIGALGGLVLFIGILLIFLPGPAIIVIPAGIAILATQFLWAKRWMDKGKEKLRKAREAIKRH